MKKDFTFTTSKNFTIRGTIFYNSSPENLPAIFIIHGFKGFKDWGYVPFFAQELADNGFFVVTFNFSHNGIGENPFEFTELEKFANNTISLEVSELDELIEFYNNGGFGFNGKNNSIGLIGHSRGGAIALIHTSEANQKNVHKNIKALALWGTIATFERYTKHQVELWKKQGFLEVINSRTNQVMRLNKVLLEDYEMNKERFNLLKCISKIKIPIIIIHGDQDLTVPLSEAFQLYESSNKSLTELVVIPSAGHTFNIVHPYQGSNPQFEQVKAKTIDFFIKHFSKN
ncbi:MAG: prolyl oligopeptidase family serine peptidase [Ignavibacteria bacterium]|nr:prolyl oligopeptidase family serine peptidase [Ignavibacteria bacterium]